MNYIFLSPILFYRNETLRFIEPNDLFFFIFVTTPHFLFLKGAEQEADTFAG